MFGRQEKEIEFRESQQKAIIENQKHDLLVVIPDSANRGAIMGLFLADVGREFFKNIGHYFMLPFAATTSLARIYFAWKNQSLHNGKDGTIRELFQTILIGVTVTTGVVGSFFWDPLVPHSMFVAALAMKSVFHGSSVIYYGIKLHRAERKIQPLTNNHEVERCRRLGKAQAVDFVVGALATVGVALVMIVSQPAWILAGSIVGITASVTGVICATRNYRLLRNLEPSREPLIPGEVLDDQLSSPSSSPRQVSQPHSPTRDMYKIFNSNPVDTPREENKIVVVYPSPLHTQPASPNNSFTHGIVTIDESYSSNSLITNPSILH